MEAYTVSERKYKLKPQSESYFPVIILYSSIMSPRILLMITDELSKRTSTSPLKAPLDFGVLVTCRV